MSLIKKLNRDCHGDSRRNCTCRPDACTDALFVPWQTEDEIGSRVGCCRKNGDWYFCEPCQAKIRDALLSHNIYEWNLIDCDLFASGCDDCYTVVRSRDFFPERFCTGPELYRILMQSPKICIDCKTYATAQVQKRKRRLYERREKLHRKIQMADEELNTVQFLIDSFAVAPSANKKE